MKNKVIIVAPGPEYIGGIAEFIHGIYKSHLSTDYELILFDPQKIKKRTLPNKAAGFNLQELKAGLRVLAEYKKLLKKHPRTVIHIHSSSFWGFYEKLLLLLIARAKGNHVLFHIHGGSFVSFFKRNKLRWLLRHLLSKANKVICVSHEIKAAIDLPSISTILGNGINCPALADKVEISSNKIIFLSVSVLEYRKRIDLIIMAAKKLKEMGYSNFEFIFAGDGPEKEKLLGMIKELDIADNVTYAGVVKDTQKDELFRRSQVFISASLSESFGISIAEGMSYGMGIISTAEGIAGSCLAQENGVLISKNDLQSLIAAMQQYLNGEQNLIEQYSLNSQYIRDNYSWDIIAEKLGALYLEYQQ